MVRFDVTPTSARELPNVLYKAIEQNSTIAWALQSGKHMDKTSYKKHELE